MRRTESNLFNLGEIVLCILVQGELSNLSKWEFKVWPDVSKIEDIDFLCLPELLGLFWCHCLNFDRPFWVVAFFDSFVKIFLRVIWGIVCGVFLSDELSSLQGLH